MTRVTYNVNEVTQMTGLGRTTIFKLMAERQLTRVKIGSRTLLLASEIDALLQRQAA